MLLISGLLVIILFHEEVISTTKNVDPAFSMFVERMNSSIGVIDMVHFLEVEHIILAIPEKGTNLEGLENALFHRKPEKKSNDSLDGSINKRSLKESLGGDEDKIKVMATMKNMGTKHSKKEFAGRNTLERYYKNHPDKFNEIEKKLRIEINNAKGILHSTKGLHYLVFMKVAMATLWNAFDEEQKTKAIKTVKYAEPEGEGDISSDEKLNDSLAGLKDDDALKEDLEDDEGKAKSMKIARELDDLDPVDKAALLRGNEANEVKKMESLVKNSGSGCSCSGTKGSSSKGEDSEEEEEDDAGLEEFDIDLEDFSEEQEEEDPLDLASIPDMGADSDEGVDFQYDSEFIDTLVRKRGISKRCACSNNSINKREVSRDSFMPPLSATVNGPSTKRFLTKANIRVIGEGCLKVITPECVALGKTRIGATAAMAAFKLLCPKCDMKITEIVLDPENPKRHGWEVVFDPSSTMDVFIMEALNTYPDDPHFYDGFNNKFMVERTGTRGVFKWRLLAHM